MAGAERFELSTRGFGGDVKTPAPRGGLTVCPKTRGSRKPVATRIDALLMLYQTERLQKGVTQWTI